MVVDSSTIIAILMDEAEAEAFTSAIAMDSVRLMPAATLLEAIVIEARSGLAGAEKFDELLAVADIY